MNISMKKFFILFFLISFNNLSAQDTFILNYEDVDIKKVTQDIAQFSKKTSMECIFKNNTGKWIQYYF